MPVEYVLHKDIDKQKWDGCIAQATNSLLYVRSFYLDAIADNWDALVMNDYEAVMPLVWRKKWGIKYLYQPSFIPQQGVFFKGEVGNGVIECFISKAFSIFKYADITLNYLLANISPKKNVKATMRNNFILPLSLSYQSLYNNYNPNFTKSLRRIQKFNFKYSQPTDIDAVLALYKSLYGSRVASVSEKDIAAFKNICALLATQNNLIIRQVYSQSDVLLGCVLLLKDDRRLYNMISCITEEGKKLEANYFLYNELIKEFSSRPLILDLEGSDIEGVANFYKKLSPQNEPYLHIKQNNLHAFVKLFKQ